MKNAHRGNTQWFLKDARIRNANENRCSKLKVYIGITTKRNRGRIFFRLFCLFVLQRRARDPQHKKCGFPYKDKRKSRRRKIILLFASPSHLFLPRPPVSCPGPTNITGMYGFVVSPSYPLNYGHNQDCTLDVWSTHGTRIVLTWLDFHLEPSSHCKKDSVTITDFSASGEPIGKWVRCVVNHWIRMCEWIKGRMRVDE